MSEKMKNLEEQLLKEVFENGGSLELDFSNDLHYEYYRSQLNQLGANSNRTPILMELIERERNNSKSLSKTALDKNGYVEGPNDIFYIDVPDITKKKYLKGSANEKSNDDKFIIYVQSVGKFTSKKRTAQIDIKIIDNSTGYTFNETEISEDCYKISRDIKIDAESLYSGERKSYKIVSTLTSVDQDKEGKPKLNVTKNAKMEIVSDDIIESFTVIDPKPKVTKGKTVHVSYNRDEVLKDFDYSINNEPLPDRTNPERIRFMLDVSFELKLKENYTINGLYMNAAPVLSLDHPYNGAITCFYYSSTKTPKLDISPDKRKVTVTLPKEPGERTAADWYSFLPFAELEDKTHDNLHIYGQFSFSVTQNIQGKTPYTFPFSVSFRSNRGAIPFTKANIENEPIYMQWGCIGEDTMITLANKKRTAMRISQLKRGQFILTADGKRRKVLNIINGKENNIYSITTETGRSILLTRTHSIKANGVWMMVGSLEEGMMVACENGEEKMVRIEKMEYGKTVYNLKFTKESALFGNGFVIGDFDMQQHIRPVHMEENKVWSEETELLMKELKCLGK